MGAPEGERTVGVSQSVLIQWKDGSYEADSSHY